ncbi:PREDICTED: uncharacterized protein LOC105571075 [Vollenhovia emeryi]|uniref:uncharacterized protein LOC105571075 n=1 Tax=Vollenhovia emeryi TaxID=411798 RepID=UPI0005F41E6B|nr:PREDICTED: uncharacterized protein LOC105571075 [Vollenhovia emeryi]
MAKVNWICIVPGCKSNSRAPGHFFPKNVTLSCKWKEAINNNIISNVSSEELRKYRVCHVHFLPDDYIYSQNRRRLKHNAVPSVNIYNIETNIAETHDTNITELHSQFEISEVSDLLNEQCGTSTQTNAKSNNELQSKISININEISTSNIECAETNVPQNIPNGSINEAINHPSAQKNIKKYTCFYYQTIPINTKCTKNIQKSCNVSKTKKPDESTNSTLQTASKRCKKICRYKILQ